MLNPVFIGLIVQLAPIGISAVIETINALTREKLDALTAEEAAAIVQAHAQSIDDAAANRQRELDRLDAMAKNPTD